MKLWFLLLIFLPVLAIAEELKVLTWNLFMIPKPITFSLQQKRAKMMARELAQTDYDMIFFQEAFSGLSRKRISNALRAKYPYQAQVGRDRKLYHVLNAGVFLVSRYPFEVLERLHYQDCAKTDCFAAKGAMLVEVTLPQNKKVQIATTHLQAWDTDATREVRKSQLTELKAMMDEHVEAQVPQLLIGDLNIDGMRGEEFTNSLQLMNMTSIPLDNSDSVTSGFPVHCYHVPGADTTPLQWLDHVWINPQGSGTLLTDRKVRSFMGEFRRGTCSLSDHHAVEATVKL